MITEYNINFHQTFAPEREYLSRLLELAGDMIPMTKEEIFNRTGIPTGLRSGKVEPHIAYAVYMGLLNAEHQGDKHHLSRTEFGEAVFHNDPHLLEPLTLLVCHYNMSSPPRGAALWQFIFQKALVAVGRNIAQDTLISIASGAFSGLKINLSPVRTCYTQEKSLSTLNLLSVTTSKTWEFASVPYQSEYRFAYAYTLLRTWEAITASRKELTLDELVMDLCWNRPFVWDEREMMNILDSLSDVGAISLNKQLSPVTVIKRSTSSTALKQMYSNLL